MEAGKIIYYASLHQNTNAPITTPPEINRTSRYGLLVLQNKRKWSRTVKEMIALSSNLMALNLTSHQHSVHEKTKFKALHVF